MKPNLFTLDRSQTNVTDPGAKCKSVTVQDKSIAAKSRGEDIAEMGLSMLEHRKQNINSMLSWSLERKVEHALKRIKEFHAFSGDYGIVTAFSGGIDSVVLNHLVRTLYPQATAVFSNTTNEFKEIVQFVKSVPNVVEVKPKMSFIETMEVYGFPLANKESAEKVERIRKDPTHKNSTTRTYLTGITSDGSYNRNSKLFNMWHKLIDAPFDTTAKCCDVLKKRPMRAFQREHEVMPLIGTHIDDSNARRKSWIEKGCNLYDDKLPSSRPISIFTKQDVWDYIRINQLPYSDIYDDKIIDGVLIQGEESTGCELCAFGAHCEKVDLFNINRFQRSKARNPKRYQKILSTKNHGVEYREALSFCGVAN